MSSEKNDFISDLPRLIRRLASDNQSWEGGQPFSNGERAALKRMNPVKDVFRPPVFWKIVCEYENQDGRELSKQRETAYAAVLQGMAITADECCSVSGENGRPIDFGTALGRYEGEQKRRGGGETVSRRFDQLLRARGERFFDLLRTLLRFTASKRIGFSWEKLAYLCLAEQEEKRSHVISQLTRSFYAAVVFSSKTADDSESEFNSSNKGE